jgi:hypothetical protein
MTEMVDAKRQSMQQHDKAAYVSSTNNDNDNNKTTGVNTLLLPGQLGTAVLRISDGTIIHGSAGLLLTRLDLDILLIYDSTKPDCMIQPSQITVDLKKVRLYFHQVKHKHLLRFYSAGLSKFVRKEIIFLFKNHISTTIKKHQIILSSGKA